MQTILSDLADIQLGFAFPSKSFTFQGEAPRILRGDNISQGNLRWDLRNAARWEGEFPLAVSLRKGDVALAMDRPWVGAGLKFASVSEEDLPLLLGQRVAVLRAKEGTHQRFLHYVVASNRFTNYILGVQTGTGVPHISGQQIMSYPLKAPPLMEQQAIAEVLGALDDQIAANSRLVRVAHELLQAMHSQTLTSVDAEVSYAEIANVGGGATPSTKNEQYWDGSIRWVAPSDVTALDAPYLDDTPRRITESGLAACSSPLYPAGSIFMTSRATIGAFAIPQFPTAVNQGFIVVQPHDSTMKWWLFHEMQRRVPEYVNRANGATFLELPRSVFRSMTIALPSPETIQRFHERAELLHASSLAAVRGSRILAQLRDTLLPALMDGRLRIRDAIEQVEGVL